MIQRENAALPAKDECSDALPEPRTEQGGSESRKLRATIPETVACPNTQRNYLVSKNVQILVRTEIDMERGGDLHERVKEYARENGIRHPRAYRELIEHGLETDGNDD